MAVIRARGGAGCVTTLPNLVEEKRLASSALPSGRDRLCLEKHLHDAQRCSRQERRRLLPLPAKERGLRGAWGAKHGERPRWGFGEQGLFRGVRCMIRPPSRDSTGLQIRSLERHELLAVIGFLVESGTEATFHTELWPESKQKQQDKDTVGIRVTYRRRDRGSQRLCD